MYKQLTREQRYTISVLLQKKMSKTFIAGAINVSKSTIFREIKRNSNVKGVYDYHQADLKTRRRKAALPGNRSVAPLLRCEVFNIIREEQWSPEQISGRLGKEGKNVSKSTIYNWIKQCPPHYRDNVRRFLRRGGKKYTRNGQRKGFSIPNRITIDERPKAGYGETPGDWEMDTIVGKGGKGAIVTLVDRYSSFMLMRKLDRGKQAKPLAETVVRMLQEAGLPVRTVTTDNGTEFAAHEIIAEKLGTRVYFAHPYSSWEKGAIENTNGLIRQYIPKKDHFCQYTDDFIKRIQDKLNNRPRKKINFSTPKEMVKMDFY